MQGSRRCEKSWCLFHARKEYNRVMINSIELTHGGSSFMINVDAIDALEAYKVNENDRMLFCAVHLRNGEVIKTDQDYEQVKQNFIIDIKAL